MARSSTKSYEIDMLNGAIFPKLLRFAVPLTLSTMLQLLFNAADVVVVGRYAGDNSLAAVGSNTALINLLTNLFLGLSIGANILAARHYGAHEDEELSKTVHTSILLSIYSGLLLTVVGILGARTILEWMQCPDNVLGLATTYLRIYFAGQTATMLYNFGAALLRAAVLPVCSRYRQRGLKSGVRHQVPDGCSRCGAGNGDFPVHFRRAGHSLFDEGNRTAAP